jgi:hypothetical protein
MTDLLVLPPGVERDDVLTALDDVRTYVLTRRHRGKAPRWLAELLFEELAAALQDERIPEAHSRFEITQLRQSWMLKTKSKRTKRAAPLKPSDNPSEIAYETAYKAVDDALRKIADCLDKKSGDASRRRRKRGAFGVATTPKFGTGPGQYALEVSGPLHGLK